MAGQWFERADSGAFDPANPDRHRQHLATGTRVGGYTIAAPLGEGAMGAVYRAHDDGGNVVALKIIHPDFDVDPLARELMAQEVSALQRLRHPNIAQVFDAELDASEAFTATELIPGKPLHIEIAEGGPLDAADLSELAHQLASALRALETAGLVHRDVKPSNIIVGESGPVLIDFGIAREAPTSVSVVASAGAAGSKGGAAGGLPARLPVFPPGTGPNAGCPIGHNVGQQPALGADGIAGAYPVNPGTRIMGTPGYMAPELWAGAPPSPATDWWSLAAVLAYAGTGRPPFGYAANNDVINRELQGRADLVGLPPRTAAALLSALNPNPADRIAPDQLLLALRRDAVAGATSATQHSESPLGPLTQAFPKGAAQARSNAGVPTLASAQPHSVAVPPRTAAVPQRTSAYGAVRTVAQTVVPDSVPDVAATQVFGSVPQFSAVPDVAATQVFTPAPDVGATQVFDATATAVFPPIGASQQTAVMPPLTNPFAAGSLGIDQLQPARLSTANSNRLGVPSTQTGSPQPWAAMPPGQLIGQPPGPGCSPQGSQIPGHYLGQTPSTVVETGSMAEQFKVYQRPILPKRQGVIWALALPLVLLAARAPVAAFGVFAALAVLVRIIGTFVNDLHLRRELAGETRSSDSAVVAARSPFTLVRAVLGALPQLLVGLGAGLLIMALGWWATGESGILPMLGTMAQPWVHQAILAFAMLVALLIGWFGTNSYLTRYGARVVLNAIAPGGAGWFFIVLGTFVALYLAYATLTDPTHTINWWPGVAPPLL